MPPEDWPLRAITMGIGTIRSARRILVLATGETKATAVRMLVHGPEDPQWPCSFLAGHENLDLFADPGRRARAGRRPGVDVGVDPPLRTARRYIVRGIDSPPVKLAPAVLAAAALVGQQVAARATRDALFLSHHDVARLPFAMAAAAVLSLVAVGASSRAMTRWPPARVVPAALAASAVLLVLEWLLSMVSAPAAAVAVYLHVAVFGATLVSGFWLLMGERFDPHSAKRALGPVGAGANAGAVLGGLIAWYAGAADGHDGDAARARACSPACAGSASGA